MGAGTRGTRFNRQPSAVADDPGWYGGINLGQSRAKIDDARTAGSVLDGGYNTTSISEDNRDTGYKILAGTSSTGISPSKAAISIWGKFGFKANTVTTVPPPSLGTLSGTVKFKGLNLDAVGILPISEKFQRLAGSD